MFLTVIPFSIVPSMINAREIRTLPRSGLELTALGLGCSQLGGLYRPISWADSEALVDAARSAGLRYFDTAPYYGYTLSPAEVVEKVRRLAGLCARFDIPLPAAALQFPFAHRAVVSCVVGARSVAQLQQNIAWLEQPIPGEYWQALIDEGLIAANAPVPKGHA